MGKEIKTNAMSILEKRKIPYELVQYESNEFTDGVHMAEKEGIPVHQTYKTLVLEGKSKEYYVMVIPVDREIDLKQAAKEVGEKSIHMVPVKDITNLTGYVRGGCSPVGMKKKFPTYIDVSARDYEKIYVSGGRIGTSLYLSPEDLLKAVSASYADLTQNTMR